MVKCGLANNLLDVLMQGENYYGDWFIAALHNPIKFKISICYLNMSLF